MSPKPTGRAVARCLAALAAAALLGTLLGVCVAGLAWLWLGGPL